MGSLLLAINYSSSQGVIVRSFIKRKNKKVGLGFSPRFKHLNKDTDPRTHCRDPSVSLALVYPYDPIGGKIIVPMSQLTEVASPPAAGAEQGDP